MHQHGRTNPVAGSGTSPTPTATNTATTNARYYEGNVQLMEARFLELSSSIRALHRSVGELREFVVGGGEDGSPPDPVLAEAVFENLGLMRKQRGELVEIVERMNRMNAHTDVPDDIRIMVLGDEEETKRRSEPGHGEVGGGDDAGVYL